MYPSTPYGMFKKIIRWHNESVTKEEDKLPEIPLHRLRHTSVTLLISQNVDFRTVSGKGHAQASATTDIYSHFLQKADEATSDTLKVSFIPKQKH